jgi:hypothetical protein
MLHIYFVDNYEPHSFVEALNGEDYNIGKKPWILSSNLHKTIKLGYLLLFDLIVYQ